MRGASRTVYLFLTGTLLAGCAVGPDYRPPQVSEPAQFMGTAKVAARQDKAPADFHAWWQGFDDPELTKLVERALTQNLDLAQAIARVSQSRASLQSATAALLPSGDISGQGAQVHLSTDAPLGSLLSARPNFDRHWQLYEANIDATWDIDVFGGLRRNREAVLAEYQASQAGVVAVRLAVAAQTADTYVTIRGLQTRIAIAKNQLDTQHRLLSTVQLQYNSGVAAELQLRQAEGALAQVEATIPVLESGLDSALSAMDVLMGAQPGTYRDELQTASPIPVAPAITDAGGPADLIRRRPDLIVAERKLAASNAEIGAAIAEYYPKFSLSGLIGSATTIASTSFTGGAMQAQGILGLRWRLFDFGRVDAEIKAAKGKNAEALAAYRLAVLRASEDVEDAFSALANRETEERSLARGEKALVRARETSFAAYQGGVVSLIEVLDADSRLLSTRDERAQAQTDAARAAIASFRALGGGWNPPSDSQVAASTPDKAP